MLFAVKFLALGAALLFTPRVVAAVLGKETASRATLLTWAFAWAAWWSLP